MKHVKLFEQFIDSFDPFGEEVKSKNILDWWIDRYISYTNEKNVDDKILENIIKIEVFPDNNIDSLEGIEKFKNLKTLFINGNLIKNFKGLEKSKEILLISASNNKITSLEGIENLKKLKILEISNNRLINLDGIENIKNLDYINCSMNQLVSLEQLKKLKKLKSIYCYNNLFSKKYIEEFKEYCDNKKIYLVP